jgi:hypothetical protein
MIPRMTSFLKKIVILWFSNQHRIRVIEEEGTHLNAGPHRLLSLYRIGTGRIMFSYTTQTCLSGRHFNDIGSSNWRGGGEYPVSEE